MTCRQFYLVFQSGACRIINNCISYFLSLNTIMNIFNNIFLRDFFLRNCCHIYCISWNYWRWNSIIICFICCPIRCLHNIARHLVFCHRPCPSCCLHIIGWRLATCSMITNRQAHFLAFLTFCCAMFQVNFKFLISFIINYTRTWIII